MDDGHKVKNTANKTTIAIRSIPAQHRFILTGTPVQNNLRVRAYNFYTYCHFNVRVRVEMNCLFYNLKEMWALFDFVCQGELLGTSKSFKQQYEKPIVRVSLCWD